MTAIKKAMILAAGLGTRMRAHMEDRPKPLVPIAEKPLINYTLDALERYGIEEVIINVHHMADQMEAHLDAQSRPFSIRISDERGERLETGGGVKAALPLLGDAPFFVINADALWTHEPSCPLGDMAEAWHDDMDALLMMVPMARAMGYSGRGDFHMDTEARLARRGPDEDARWLFGGVQILRPALMEGTPEGPFSLNLVYDKALGSSGLYGAPLTGRWFHVGDAEGVKAAEDWAREQQTD